MHRIHIGLLLLTKPKKLKGILPIIKQHVSKTLYVQLYRGRQRLVNSVPSNERVSDLLHHGPAVLGLYFQLTAACQHMDVRVLLTGIKDPFLSTIYTRKQIELVIFDRVFDEVEVDNFFKSCLLNATQKCRLLQYLVMKILPLIICLFISITGTMFPKHLNHSAPIECYQVKN